MLLAALSHVCRRHRISIHKTQLCQNATLFSIYDLTFFLKLSIPAFGRNLNLTLLGKNQSSQVFVTLILRVAVKFQAQKKSKDCVILSIRTWEMTVIIVSSVCTDIYWSVLDHSSHWSAPVSHCRVQNPTQPVWSLASHALQCHRHISQAALSSFQWEAPSHPGASFSSSSGPVRKYVGKV